MGFKGDVNRSNEIVVYILKFNLYLYIFSITGLKVISFLPGADFEHTRL